MKQKLLSLLFLLMGMVQGTMAQKEAYAVLSSDGNTVTFYYDTKKASREGVVEINNTDNRGSSAYGTATQAVIDKSFADYRPTSTAYWFEYCTKMSSISGMENLNTENVTDMRYMFSMCTVECLDLSHFNTANVTNMRQMFDGASHLTSLDISHFNTENVENMGAMFRYVKLTSLDLSHFNTIKVTSMANMFKNSSITKLNLSSFDTSNVTTMEGMFRETSFSNLDLSNFNTEKVKIMADMFYRCRELVSLDLSSFNTKSVTSMYEMFGGCSALTTIYADESKWDTSKVNSSQGIFMECTNLVGGNGTKYSETYRGLAFACIDKDGQPGYLTQKTSSSRNVAIDATNFPDEALRNALLSQGVGTDGVLSSEEITSTTSLDLSGKGISDLKGLEIFTALAELNISKNKIAGEAMDALIASLPTIPAQAMARRADSTPGKLYVIDSTASDEGNAMTEAQAATAVAKGWQPYYNNGTEWVTYSGGTPSGIKGVFVNVDKSAPVYNLRGQHLSAPQRGINIIGGKKVIVK